MEKYEIKQSDFGSSLVRNNDDGSVTLIPTDPANSDYQRYLRWLENPDADESGTL